MMNLKRKGLLLLCLLIAVFAAGCAFEQSPYEINDSEGYTVSVRFDANGGSFTTVNTPAVVDSYNVSQLAVNENGKVEIPLLAPNDPQRNKDAFTPTRNGYFLVGWYAVCETTTDSEGNTLCTYAQPWDFAEDRLEVDPKGEHASAEPVLTLYAAWAPLYEVRFYDLDSGELRSTLQLDPAKGLDLTVPHWSDEGNVEMYQFPQREGYTFQGVYADAEGTVQVETSVITHPGQLDSATATVENGIVALYVDWMEGEWYRISTAEQFVENFSLNGCYEIMADLDFSEEIWPTAMMYGSFNGMIRGNGHTISNVHVEQTNNSKVNAGLFGQLTETAVVENLSFENACLTIKAGTRVAGTAYGLLAGAVSDGAAVENVSFRDSFLEIDSGCYFGTEDYVIGLVCGMGETDVDPAGITCVGVGAAPENVLITEENGSITVEFAN